MTCKQLGGSCDLEFSANTFQEILDMSQDHGQKMLKKRDMSHFEAMSMLQQTLTTKESIIKWARDKKDEFDRLPRRNVI